MNTRKDIQDVYGMGPMYTSAESNNKEIIEFFLMRGAGINEADENGETPLHLASLGGHLDTLHYLINNGANIGAKDSSGKTPIDIARDKGHNNIVKYLQRTQLALDAELLTAVKDGDLDNIQNINKIRGLIARGANINTKDENGDTLLYFFAGLGDLGRTRFLLENYAGTEVKNEKYDQTPLHTATQNSKLKVVRLLLSFNANVNATDSIHWMPSHYAASVGDLDIMKVLADAHANLSATGDYGKTPLDIAKGMRYNKIVEYLEEKLREGRGERKRRHHHGGHNSHHLSRKPRAIDSSNQPEIATSSGIRPSSWINDLFGWIRSSVDGLLSSVANKFATKELEGSKSGDTDAYPARLEKVYSATIPQSRDSLGTPRGNITNRSWSSHQEKVRSNVTAALEINTDVVNSALILADLAVRFMNGTRYKQPIHENLLSPREQSMRFIDEDIIIRAIQQGKEKFGVPGTNMDEVEVIGNKTEIGK